MGLLGRWGSRSLGTVLALLFGLLLTQLPALTAEYAATLLQIAEDGRRDIDQREASARHRYAIDAATDAELVSALQAHEPSNAESLERSLRHVALLERAEQRIQGPPPLLQPLAALEDALDDPEGDKAPIWRMLLQTYHIRFDLTVASALYGGGGLVLGSLLAQLLLLPVRRLVRARSIH